MELTEPYLKDIKEIISGSSGGISIGGSKCARVLLTSSVLSANSTYTSDALDVSIYPEIIVRTYTDKPGTLNIYEYHGSSWINSDEEQVFGGTPHEIVFYPTSDYIRISYQNGNQNQTYFYLAVSLVPG